MTANNEITESVMRAKQRLGIVGNAPALLEAVSRAIRVAPIDLSVLINGESGMLPETSYGYADKHWGRSFNRPWFQFACGKLASQRAGQELRHSALAVNAFCPRFLGIPLGKRLMLQLTYRGEDFEFTRCKWETKETGKRYVWHILAQDKSTVVKISGSCTKAEMIRLQYENPEGRKFRIPPLGGCAGIGNLQLFRKGSGGREWMDTLTLENALCIYRPVGSAAGKTV